MCDTIGVNDMSPLTRVPCVDINANNLDNWWPHMITAINSCNYVALDLELSGLGARDKLNAKQIDERYKAVVCTAKTRSVLSIGFAFFTFTDKNSGDISNKCVKNKTKTKKQTNCQTKANNSSVTDDIQDVNSESDVKTGDKQWKITAKVFNLLCLCDEEYICEPETMRFLASHGFDFNGQCLHGLPYHRGNDTEYEDSTTPSIRKLITEIIRHKLPIVLHNGFIDLVFLYQNFYSDLPNDLQTFIADLVELFPSGIFDTKYIADFHERLNRSYLEYLFYEKQRYNIERSMNGQTYIDITFTSYSHNLLDIEYQDLSTKIASEPNIAIDICLDYANHGWCKLKDLCKNSHNIDHILDKKNTSKRIKKMIRKLKKKNEEQLYEDSNDEHNSSPVEMIVNMNHSRQGVHSAGYDAFMTGYCFAYYMAVNAKSRQLSSKQLCFKSLGISQLVNNIYLIGKDQSLRINASSFAKTSNNHKIKIKRIHTNNS
ncbi:target of EGR1 protein 1-like [Oppia nitens]|uniref:target of EGR1 protein 1-like n=1 Tax=Oppia nitens TaxID=1686743 RepID=UPI0023DBA4AA|nr:target of EGR1 protein 1-like [Oppia nitens]